MSCFLLAVALAIPDLSEIVRGFEATQRKHTGFCCLVTMTKGQAEQSKQTVARLYKINDSWRIDYLQTPLAGTPIFAPGNPGVTSGYLVRKDKIIQYVRSPSRSILVTEHPAHDLSIMTTLDQKFISPVNSLYEVGHYSIPNFCDLPDTEVISRDGKSILQTRICSPATGEQGVKVRLNLKTMLVEEWNDEIPGLETSVKIQVIPEQHPQIGPVVRQYIFDTRTQLTDRDPEHYVIDFSDYQVWKDDSVLQLDSLFLFNDPVAIEKDGKLETLKRPEALDEKSETLFPRLRNSPFLFWLVVLSLGVVTLVLISIYKTRTSKHQPLRDRESF